MTATNDEKSRYVEIWSKAVDTQMHFNEMSVRSRQLGLTFVTAALGVSIVLFTRGNDFSIPVSILNISFQIHVSVLLVLAASAALFAVKILDLNVYHKMLRGAATFGEDFENNYMKKIFDLDKGMTQAISHYSRYQDADVETVEGKFKYIGSQKITAEAKIRKFYFVAFVALIVSAVLLFVFTVQFAVIEQGGSGS